MADPTILDPFESNFPGGGAYDYDPIRYDGPPDLSLPPGFMDGFDVDDDLDFDGDIDFSIADLLNLPDATDDDLPPGGGEGGSDCKEGCGASSSSSASVNLDDGSPDRDEKPNAASPDSGGSTTGEELAKQEEEEEAKSWSLKRKKGKEEMPDATVNPDPRSSKFRRSATSEKAASSCVFNPGNEEDEKRKARLMRNRESAQLSRQRKKHYVEELEEKVKAMHSTITELNGKISFIMAENASLRQQLNGGGGKGNCAAPAVYPPLPPVTSMHFPWIPCSGYAVRPPGAQVPLIPIPRLKTQQLASAPKPKKSESRKAEGKTKKVAGVSLLGLLFCMLFLGIFVPGSKLGLDGSGEIVFSERASAGGKFMRTPHGRVLTVRSSLGRSNITEGVGVQRGNVGVSGGDHGNKMRGAEAEHDRYTNGSKPLFASLYVPRNNKLVKIEGNLIIQSVLASEKAKAHLVSGATSRRTPEKVSKETSLAIASKLASTLAISRSGRDSEGLYRSIAEHQRTLAYGSKENCRENKKSTPGDGPLKEWFREGLEGPILSSGMCTEVFQFDVSANAGGIIPATPVTNFSDKASANSSQPERMKNRRALHSQAIPLPGATANTTADDFRKNRPSSSSVVVSVLVDPRETGDNEGERVITPKAVPRIFVVVLLDSVKYVTYSCVLPFKSAAPHL